MPEIDTARVERLLVEIEEALNLIREALMVSKQEFLSDIKSIYAVRYAIIRIVEAASLLGMYILEAQYGITPETYSDIFQILSRRDVISADVSEGFRRVVGLRNLIVHRYWVVDDSRIYEEAKGNGLKVIRMFIDEVRRYVREKVR